MAIQFSNLASSLLASGVSSTATSISVNSASSFPSLGDGDYFYATIGAGAGSEIVKVTGISGTTFTVDRGQDDTTAVSHSAGVDVALRVTAGTLEDLRDGGQVYTAGSGISLSGNEFSLTDKSNYDTAYGWGDHSTEGYLTSFDITTQTDSKYLRSNASDSVTNSTISFNSSSRLTGANAILDGFAMPQNPEGKHIKSPFFFNDIAYSRVRGATISVEVDGVAMTSTTSIDNMLNASGDFWNMSTAGKTTATITITNSPKNLTYGSHMGLSFGNTNWRAKNVELEYSTDNGTTWTSVKSVTNQNEEFVTGSWGMGAGVSANAFRWTLSNFNTTSMRVASLFAYNYNSGGMKDLYVTRDGGSIYGDIAVTGTVDGRDVSVDGTKLDGIAANANNYSLPFTDNSTNWNTAYGWGDHGTQSYATETYVDTAVSDLVDSSPAALNTLNELAAALGDDENFSTTVTDSIATKLPLAGGTMTGNIAINKTSPEITLHDTNSSTGSFPKINFTTTNNQGVSLYHNEFDNELPAGGYGLVLDAASNNTQYPTTGTLSLVVKGEIFTGSTTLSGTNKVWHEGTLTTTNKSNYDTAYGWGNHAGLYLPLAGGTMTGKISMFQNNDIFGLSGTIANYPRLSFYSSEGTHAAKTQTLSGDLIGQIDFNPHTGSSYTGGGKISFISTEAITSSERGTEARIYSTKTGESSLSYHQFKDDELYIKNVGGNTYKYWHAGNDGGGSGLDADTVDGVQASRIIYGNSGTGTSEGTFTDWNSINKSGFYSDDDASNKWSTANWSSVLHHRLYSSNNRYATQLGFDTYNNNLYTRTNNNDTWTSWEKIWHSGVDGSGSGLDADLLDGQHGSYYAPANHVHSYYLPLSGGTLTGTTTFTDSIEMAYSSGNTFNLLCNNTGSQTLNIASNDLDTGVDKYIYIGKNTGTNAGNSTIIELGDDSSGSLVKTFSDLQTIGTITATGGNSTNWNTAYGWGDHALAGYTSNVGDITGVTAGTGMTGGGTSGAVTLNVIGGTGITANANNITVDSTVLTTSTYGTTLNPVYAPVKKGTATLTNSYQTVCTVNGNALASTVRMSICGTGNNTVIGTILDIVCNHSLDILVTSQTSTYTLLTVKIVSNNNEDFAVQLKTNHANDLPVNMEVFALNSEAVAFTSTNPYSGASLEHECKNGGFASSSSGGAAHEFYSNGTKLIAANDNQALHDTDALSISGSTITLRKGDNTTETIAIPPQGDITGVTAGNGLTGGGTSGTPTINVGAGSGITANADDIEVDSTVIRTTGDQSMSGVKTFTGDTAWSDGNSFYVAGSGGGRVSLPAGASYFTTASAHTGAVKIKLPTASKGKSDMISFEVTIYDYALNESVKLLINAYQYSDVNWNNQSVVTLASQTGKDYTVRFGSDATSHCLWIGETTSVWSHPQVSLSNFMCGYSASAANYVDGWSISFVTAFDTVQDTVTSSLPMAQYAQDADKLDGQQGSYYLPTTGKAADSNLLDGIDSTRVIYGSGASGTTNANPTVTSSPYQKSGFYDVHGSSNNAPTNTYYSYINMRHTNTSNNHGHQIAGSFYSQGDLYNRQINNNNYGSWSKIWNTTNDGSGSGLDADLLDGQDGSYYYSSANPPPLTADPTLTLTGDVTGSATFTNLGNATLTATVANDSHSHAVIASKGVLSAETLRSAHASGVYTFNTHNASLGNSTPTTYWSTIGFGRGTTGMAEIATSWTSGGNNIWFRSLRDTTDNWWDWKQIWHSGNDGSGSGLDADLLDGQHGSYYAPASHSHSNYTPLDHFRAISTRNYVATTTSALMDELLADDYFDSHLAGGKASWSYSGNGNLTDAGRLTELAGCSFLTWTDTSTDNTTGNYTAMVIAPNSGGSAGKMFVFNNQGSSYSPGWREIWTSTSDGSGSGLDADLLDGQHGSYYAPASHAHSYLPLTGGTVTGQIIMSGTSPQIKFNDTNGGDCWLHVNTNRFYILPDRDSNGSWDTPYALELNWSNDTAQAFGSTIWTAGNDGSGSGLDADTCDGQHLGSTAFVQFGGVTYKGFTSSSITAKIIGSGDSGSKLYWRKSDTDTLMSLDMSGNLTATGNVTAYSDRRIKENITPITEALSKVQRLTGNTYTRNDQEDTATKYAGLIAQEVEDVLPEAVREVDDGIKALDYNATIALLVESIKELKAEVDDLKSKLENK